MLYRIIVSNTYPTDNLTCYYIETTNKTLTDKEYQTLHTLLVQSDKEVDQTLIKRDHYSEYGSVLNWKTPWCSNMLTIMSRIGVSSISRIEKTRWVLKTSSKSYHEYDPILEQEFLEPITYLDKVDDKVAYVKIIPLDILEEYNIKHGLAMDEQDFEYYKNIFQHRAPTEVELFDLAQSNSEHSRHWFFNGGLYIKNKKVPHTLFELVKKPYKLNPRNSLVAFSDNSSAIEGTTIPILIPECPFTMSTFSIQDREYVPTCTAETHNFPTGVAPFPGASTGVGGRIRDNQCIGRGGLVMASVAGYCVGNLNLPDYKLPWEITEIDQNSSFATPLSILIKASNGASDYGNKFGEPIICGFTRSYGLYHIESRRHIEWAKPIMFSAGIAQTDRASLYKKEPEKGQNIVRIGGPAYRIGIGGGSASSREQTSETKELDWNAVQRGDPEMENRMNRLVRSCVELGDRNPIMSIHDQGAGGMGNVTKEIAYPLGGEIDLSKVTLGDTTLNTLEIWTSEHQEQNTLLIDPKNMIILENLGKRENVDVSVIGTITGTGRIVVKDRKQRTVVDIDLEKCLGDTMPQKRYDIHKIRRRSSGFFLPVDVTLEDMLDRVFRLVTVGSKKFLTNKVDRSVTGLIAQQQCVGPYQIPLSNYAVIAQSHFTNNGIAFAVGEQSIKGLLSPEAMVQIAISEMLTNLMWAKITNFEDIKCSANWMWPRKLAGESFNLYVAARELSRVLCSLGIAIDGGKDSLSMFSKSLTVEKDSTGKVVDRKNKTIISPGTLVLTAYARMNDVRKKIQPCIRHAGSLLCFINISNSNNHLGVSALAQVYTQLGMISTYNANPMGVKHVFKNIQSCIGKRRNGIDIILSGHDRSDGGLITTILEMCFSGGYGCSLHFDDDDTNWKNYLFNEGSGIVIEVNPMNKEYIEQLFKTTCPIHWVGRTLLENRVLVQWDNVKIMDKRMTDLRETWESTSFELEKQQCLSSCVREEQIMSKDLSIPSWVFPDKFLREFCNLKIINYLPKVNVGILREEGSNGDREMAAAFHMAGATVWDISMNDLILSDTNLLSKLQGLVFVGGFSFSDVMGAGAGWEATIQTNPKLKQWFQEFYDRPNTFSLGICNGCQLLTRLGWVGNSVDCVQNMSGRFESRWSTISIQKTNSIFFKNMDGVSMGVWVAHGEGHFSINKSKSTDYKKLDFPVRYIGIHNEPTEKYPYNPNGSPDGATAISSSNGRHLAMMPHPERSFLQWQLPYCPDKLPCKDLSKISKWGMTRRKESILLSPWFMMFANAVKWCSDNK